MRTFFAYWLGIYKESRSEIQNVFGIRGEIIRLSIVIVVLVGSLWHWKGMNFAIENTWSGFWPNIIGILILFFIAPIAAYFNMFRIAALRDKSQRDRLSIKEYEDIEIEEYHSPETIDEQRKRLLHSKVNRKLEVSFRNNGSTGLFDCWLRIADISLLSSSYNNKTPNPELRALKWLVGDDANNGRVDLPPKSLPYPVWIAIAEINPIAMFKFVFCDAIAESYYFVQGRYELIVQLEGKIESGGKMVNIIPIPFIITFNFDISGINPMFKIIEIKKFPKDAAEQSVYLTGGIRPA